MQCITNQNCPALQICIDKVCQHSPLYDLSLQTVFSFFVLPVLLIISNRIGMSAVWVLYPILVVLMAYSYRQAVQIISPMALAGGCIMLYLSLKEKTQTKLIGYHSGSDSGSQQNNRQSNSSNSNTKKNVIMGAAVNFYMVNISIPVLVVGVNLGLIFAKVAPFLYIGIVGILMLIGFAIIGYYKLKDIKSQQLIMQGYFRKMLPERIKQNSPLKQKQKSKSNITIQLSQIAQSDRQIQQNQNNKEMPPTDKKKVREQLISQMQTQFPTNQFLICLATFIGYEALCVGLIPLIGLGVQTTSYKILISYSIIIPVLIIGELILYKFYIEPKKKQQQFIKLRLSLGMLGSDNEDTNRIVYNILKNIVVVFIGSIMEGWIGFGLYYLMFFYLIFKQNPMKDTIATCGFMTIFIGTIYTVNQIFCGHINVAVYVVVFLLTLGITSGCQYLFNSYIDRNVDSTSTNSFIILSVFIVQGICLASVCLGIYLTDSRFGSDGILGVGSIQNC